jgi:unsaturated chondroitin disaccharide hydrolase
MGTEDILKIINEVKLQNPERYESSPDFIKENLQNAIDAAIKKVDYMMETLGDGFATPVSQNNVYEAVDNITYGGWNQGFWTGILWLSWELTGDAKYKELALSHVPSFRQRIEGRHGVNQ